MAPQGVPAAGDRFRAAGDAAWRQGRAPFEGQKVKLQFLLMDKEAVVFHWTLAADKGNRRVKTDEKGLFPKNAPLTAIYQLRIIKNANSRRMVLIRSALS
jgi:hypothetical protein